MLLRRSRPTGECLALTLVFTALAVLAIPLTHAQQPSLPSIAFTCDFPGSDPAHYSFSVFSDGQGSYISDGKLSRSADAGEPSSLKFVISRGLTSHVFDLARQANYFEGHIDSRKKNIASTGDKSLSYKDGQRTTLADYNYSTIPAIQELTSTFQKLSSTLEFGRRLEYDYHYQKLALDDELKRMEAMASREELSEIAMVAPILQKILDDSSVINGVRARAQRLLGNAASGSK